MDSQWHQRVEQVAREDLVLFINACLACTGQREFYDDAWGQKVSIDFLHDYILGNYRLLYTRTLAAGINHFNQTQIIVKLLATGRNTPPEHREEEGALIAAALKALPPQRAWAVLEQLRKRRVNNRRSRAIAREYLASRGDRTAFEAVKYRAKMRAIAVHAHLKLEGELSPFLFRHWQSSFQTELFERFRQGHYSATAIYHLPFTVAEGLATKHNIPRQVFLQRIESRMTAGEKLRLQGSVDRAGGKLQVEFHRLPLTKLALYALSLSPTQRQEQGLHRALQQAAQSALRKAPLSLQKVAAVLDCSYSSSGSSEKRRRSLGVALAVHYLLQTAAREYQGFWTIPIPHPVQVVPRGQTDLATPLLAALDWQPDLVLIVSDGWENDPPNGAAEIIRVFRQKIDPNYQISIIHCNPVFNADDFSLKRISLLAPTVGLRDAEDLPIAVGFARFADGSAPLSALEHYLAGRVQQMLAGVAIDRKEIAPEEIALGEPA
jgi:hypothetical protein